jgi:hypothetical protein
MHSKPEGHENYYGFSLFAMQLNYLTDEMKK